MPALPRARCLPAARCSVRLPIRRALTASPNHLSLPAPHTHGTFATTFFCTATTTAHTTQLHMPAFLHSMYTAPLMNLAHACLPVILGLHHSFFGCGTLLSLRLQHACPLSEHGSHIHRAAWTPRHLPHTTGHWFHSCHALPCLCARHTAPLHLLPASLAPCHRTPPPSLLLHTDTLLCYHYIPNSTVRCSLPFPSLRAWSTAPACAGCYRSHAQNAAHAAPYLRTRVYLFTALPARKQLPLAHHLFARIYLPAPRPGLPAAGYLYLYTTRYLVTPLPLRSLPPPRISNGNTSFRYATCGWRDIYHLT